MDNAVQGIGDLALSQALTAKTALAPTTLSATTMASIDKNAQQFESMFMSQMFEPMFESVEVDPTFGGGHGEETMRSFLVQEFGKMAAKSGRVGIASAVKSEMIRMQTAANAGGIHTPSASVNLTGG